MSTNKIMNVCFGTTNPNQQDKKFYSQHGILVFGTNDKGEERISLKLSSMPIDADSTLRLLVGPTAKPDYVETVWRTWMVSLFKLQ